MSKDFPLYEKNLAISAHRIGRGLDMLRQHYELRERSVSPFESFMVAGRRHVVRQFDIAGVGNLLVMTNPDEGPMQMDTFTITPYFKNLPLFTTDYLYFQDKRSCLNELYDLVDYQDDLYADYIGRFAANCAEYASWKSMQLPPCWYDDIRPVLVAKDFDPSEDDRACQLFERNLATFIEMEQRSPLLEGRALQAKWEKNFAYARSLVEDGGVSTALFVESLGAEETKRFFYEIFFAPYLYGPKQLCQILRFFDSADESGIPNGEKVKRNQRIIRRVETTDKDKSYEAAGSSSSTESEQKTGAQLLANAFPSGMAMKEGKLRGFGIDIFNEDVYPLQSFEIYLRNCDLTGSLNLDGCEDLVFLDVYHNRIAQISTAGLSSMRIFGVQDNLLEKLDPTQMPACQGIDAGMNKLTELDVSQNPELVELYINDNDFSEIDLSHNPKLKYFYCHNNRIGRLDTRANPLLRHLNATGNPMTDIFSLAPQRDERLPLELHAGPGGHIGLKFNPIYNAQWKETGEWQQSYHAYPEDGFLFAGWFDDQETLLSDSAEWVDAYGESRVLTARFRRAE